MSNTPSPLHCPFCGSSTIAHHEVEGRANHSFECCECLASSMCKPTYQEALEAWNRRAPQPVVREPLTANQAQELIELESWGVDAITLNAQLMRTIRRTEAAHGITQKGVKDAE